jgi:16S rRNA (uracil1498-N3)-methyltransferase
VPAAEKGGDAKAGRWRRIADQAAKQCMRADIPAVEGVSPFRDVLEDFRDGARIIAHTGAVVRFADLERPEGAARVSVLVGPEGGFSPGETAAATDAGWVPVLFGNTHMRAETAAIVIPALVLCLWGG